MLKPDIDLPVEISTRILSLIRPTSSLKPRNFSVADSLRDYDYPAKKCKQYYQELEVFSSLRYVCRSWDAILCTMIYSDIILPSEPLEEVRRVVGILRHHQDLVRSLMICNFRGSTSSNNEDARKSTELLDSYLKELQGARLRKIELLGSGPVFRTRTWNVLPNLSDSLTHLSLSSCNSKVMSLALSAVGCSVQHLEIIGWTSPMSPLSAPKRPPLHLPAEIPKLISLVLTDCGTFMQDYSKLFQRIGALAHCRKRNRRVHRSSLRELYLGGSSNYRDTEIVSFLQTNKIGLSLTVLHITLPPGDYYSSTSGATAIAKECPSLVEFRYVGAIRPSLFPALPPSLKSLAVSLKPASIYPVLYGHIENHLEGYFAPDCLADVISSKSRYTLERLTIIVSSLSKWRKDTERPAVTFHEADLAAIASHGIIFRTEYLPHMISYSNPSS